MSPAEAGSGPLTVALVGAGPGDPGLMTRRSLELIAAADIIFHDRLIPPGALSGARREAEIVDVGKRPGQPGVGQDEINRRLVEAGRAGLRAVRLKGGDPFVFGRGAEEASALQAAGVPFEVVPGVTAGIAASACAGIPLTHRGQAAAVTFVAGHEDPQKEGPGLDLAAVAKLHGTIVFYMGLKNLAANANELINGGRPPGEPAAVIERGTTTGQRTVTGSLETIAELSDAAGLRSPALVVVGEVVRLREQLAWFESRPLFGCQVVVTRPRDRNPVLAGRLRALGAQVIELPVSRTELIEAGDSRVADPLARLKDGGFDLVCFTSPAGVDALFGLLGTEGLDARVFAGKEVAVIGPSTARSLAGHGLKADHLPRRSVSEGMVEMLAELSLEGRQVLIARAEEGRELLPDALKAGGADVTVMPVYRMVAEPPPDELLDQVAGAAVIAFSSASSVRNLVRAGVRVAPGGPKVVTIGPATSEAAREAGLDVALEAGRHDLDGLVEAIQAAGA